MCGIAGIISKNLPSFNLKEKISLMSKTIAHRGPDSEGIYFAAKNKCTNTYTASTEQSCYSNSLEYSAIEAIEEYNANDDYIALAHRRLAIIDLTATGHQPMSSLNKNLWITFNGEIYNYLEIKNDLIKLGYHFISNSDTEVILKAYQHWGTDCVKHFNGMWAFAIHDRTKNILFCSRDITGVKPFYFYFDHDKFLFASEQKALLKSNLFQSSINTGYLRDYLAYNIIEHEEESLFQNIKELKPRTNLILKLDSFELSKEIYFEPSSLIHNQSDYEVTQDGIEQIKEHTKSAIKLRMRSDVAVGSCLSGGIDSSIIASEIALHKNNFGQLFTASFPGYLYDESNYAKLVADSSKLTWHQCNPIGADLHKNMEDLVYSQDLPLWSSSTYAQYSVFSLIKSNNIKVVLDGQGADELFGGYVPYKQYLDAELKRNNIQAYQTEVDSRLDNSGLKKYFLKQKIKSFALNSNSIFLKSLINKDLQFINADLLNIPETISHHADKTLNEHLLNEFFGNRLKTYLKCEDRCAMFHSVESRTPFADDINLIKQAFSLNASYKIKNDTLKYGLREAFRGQVPESILDRKDKIGYQTPHNKWIEPYKAEILNLAEKNLSEFININQLRSKINQIYISSNTAENTFLFKIWCLAIWRGKFVI